MDQPLYDIYFTGQLVEGIDPETGKSNLAKLFKSTPEKVASFFDGKPHLLKRGIDKPGALKYKAALHKAGLLVAFKTQPITPTKAAIDAAINEQTASTGITEAATDTDWSLAPVGSDVLKDDERQSIEERDIDTSSIKMVSAFMEIEPEPTVAPPAPDTRHISVAAVGEDLLNEKPESPPPLPIDLSKMTLAPAGSILEELHDNTTPLNPDTSGFSIAVAGVDILEGQTKQAPPPAPNTDHITVAKD